MHYYSPKERSPKSDAKRVPAPRKEAYVPASPFTNANRQFISTINLYSIHNPYIIGIKLEQYLPSAFVKSNVLVNRRCKMILRDEKQRSWSVLLAPMGHYVAITRGWRQFREANDVQMYILGRMASEKPLSKIDNK
ncbi:putative B3 domain-containing protein REM17-like [Capsicum annuum]|nr:putative B3 domain-containing protein REM17-like [Capsicum annuum]